MENTQVRPKAAFSWPLLGSNFASVFGDGVYRFGLNWFLVASYGDAKVLGWLTGFGFFVYLLNDVFVGAILDRFNRKWALVLADLFGATGLLTLSWLINPEQPQIWLLLVLTFILNVDISFAYPAGRAILPEVIRPDALARFNAFTSAAFSTGQAFGPLVGGVLLQLNWIDLKSFLLIYGLMLLATMMMNVAIKYYPQPKQGPHEAFWPSLVAGYKYVVHEPTLLQSMLLTMWSNFFFEGFIIAMPFLIQQDYHGTATDYSMALTLAALAGIVGGLLLARFPKMNTLNSLYGDYYVLGIAFLLGTFVQNLWVFAGLVVMHGFMRALFVIKINTVRQMVAAPEYLGRVFGISFFATDLFAPLITIGVGYGVSVWHEWTVFILGAMLLLGNVAIQAFGRWNIKRHQTI